MTVIDLTPLKGQMLPGIGIWIFWVVSSADFPFCNMTIKNLFATLNSQI